MEGYLNHPNDLLMTVTLIVLGNLQVLCCRGQREVRYPQQYHLRVPGQLARLLCHPDRWTKKAPCLLRKEMSAHYHVKTTYAPLLAR